MYNRKKRCLVQFNQLLNWLESYTAYSILICFGFLLVALLIIISLTAKNRKLSQRLAKLESAQLPERSSENPDLQNFDARLERLETNSSSLLRHVAMIRFNAFDHVGNGLSFALAVLNDNGDGFVISSLFGGEETRTYAKQISGGKPSHPLSPEEEEAIKKAMGR
jgi:hypothetical protein